VGTLNAGTGGELSGYLLDTTVVIDHAHGHSAGVQMVRKLFGETSELYTCDVVTCEALSRGESVELHAVGALLQALEYVALSPDDAAWAGDARRELIKEGRRKPSTADALIAALAHSLGATVVTRNTRDFEAFDIPVLGYGEEST
jgi:predicted nucleic acid-binding protein